MTAKKQNALREQGADTEHTHRDYTRPIAARIKGFIVALALWGLVPVKLAEWIIRRGGLRHE